jgi:ClpX C4-type zinc finger
MADFNNPDYATAYLELQEAFNALRKLKGEPPIDYLPINKANSTPVPPICSCCGKGKNQVRTVLPRVAAHICNECIELAHSIITAGI